MNKYVANFILIISQSLLIPIRFPEGFIGSVIIMWLSTRIFMFQSLWFMCYGIVRYFRLLRPSCDIL